MPFKAYLPLAFSHTHKNVMFDALVEKLTRECADKPEPHFLVGNFPVEGEELDTLFIKPDAICVVEFKHCSWPSWERSKNRRRARIRPRC